MHRSPLRDGAGGAYRTDRSFPGARPGSVDERIWHSSLPPLSRCRLRPVWTFSLGRFGGCRAMPDRPIASPGQRVRGSSAVENAFPSSIGQRVDAGALGGPGYRRTATRVGAWKRLRPRTGHRSGQALERGPFRTAAGIRGQGVQTFIRAGSGGATPGGAQPRTFRHLPLTDQRLGKRHPGADRSTGPSGSWQAHVGQAGEGARPNRRAKEKAGATCPTKGPEATAGDAYPLGRDVRKRARSRPRCRQSAQRRALFAAQVAANAPAGPCRRGARGLAAFEGRATRAVDRP